MGVLFRKIGKLAEKLFIYSPVGLKNVGKLFPDMTSQIKVSKQAKICFIFNTLQKVTNILSLTLNVYDE